MRYLTVLIQLLYALSGVAALAVAGYLWENRDNRGAKPLIATNLSVGFWILLVFIATVTPSPVNEFTARLLYFPLSTSVASIFTFALEYTGKEEYVTKRNIALLAIHPIIGLLLAFINPNEAYITVLEPTNAGVIEEWGILFWIHATYSYTLILTAATLILQFFLRNNKRVYQGQSILLIIGIVAGISLNAVYLFSDIIFNTSAVGTVIAMITFSYAVIKYDLTNITPVAREKIVKHIRDGVIVLDKEDTVININDSAKNVLNIDRRIIGDNILDAVENEEFEADYNEIIETPSNESIIEYGSKHLRFQHEVMENNRGEEFGRLLIIEDITKQMMREEEMRKKNEQLDQFASTIAHDLRNPLSAAKGFLNTGLRENNEEMLEEAQQHHKRMEEMIEEILTLSKAGNEVEDTEEVNLAHVAEQGWKHAETEEGALEMLFDETVSLKADKTRLLQIFENLFRNAQEHNDGEATVSVGLLDSSTGNEENERYEGTESITGFFIADDGSGIPAEKREKVFEHGHTTNSDGTGFGLSIIKDIVEAHGWNVTINDSADGGARFEINGVDSISVTSSTN